MLVYNLFEFVFESVPGIRNNNAIIMFNSKYNHITVVSEKKIKCSLYIFSIVFHLNLWFKLNSFLRLLVLSAGIHEGREKKPTKKTIKYKLGGSSKM